MTGCKIKNINIIIFFLSGYEEKEKRAKAMYPIIQTQPTKTVTTIFLIKKK
jgi:hypothetical protein